MQKKTLVVGASENPERYANMAVRKLTRYGHPVLAFGKVGGRIDETSIETTWPEQKDIDTITLYLNPTHQRAFYDRIIQAAPKRIIFNPGTENPELESLAQQHGIETIEACTLVLLSIDQY